MNNGIPKGYHHIITLCPRDECPKVYFNASAPEDKAVLITDDFGGQVFLSKGEFETMQKSNLL